MNGGKKLTTIGIPIRPLLFQKPLRHVPTQIRVCSLAPLFSDPMSTWPITGVLQLEFAKSPFAMPQYPLKTTDGKTYPGTFG